MNTISLQALFDSLQDELGAALRGSRTVPHAGLQGDASESDWLRMLEALPWRYRASRAMVVDSRGRASEQIDLVVHDRQYSPLLFRRGQQLYVPAESVYAVFEIKQHLTRRTLRAAGTKAASVRRLHRTSGPVPHAGGIEKPRKPFRIPAGILCFDSHWRDAFGEPFTHAMSECTGDLQLDLGCVLRRGAFNRPPDAPETLETRPAATALVYFFVSLLQHLQRLATVPAIEYSAYLQALD